MCLHLRRHDTQISRVAALLIAAALSCAAGWQIIIDVGEAKLLARKFCSSLCIVKSKTSQGRLRKMEHGGVEHGSQLLDRDESLQPVAYYRKHVSPSGVLLFQVSNHFVDMQPALALLAANQGLIIRVVADEPEGAEDIASPLSASTSALVTADRRGTRLTAI